MRRISHDARPRMSRRLGDCRHRQNPIDETTMSSAMTVVQASPDRWGALAALFGRAGASNGCWCQYPALGPRYHERDRALNRAALEAELTASASPAPGLLAMVDGAAVGWARLTPRSALPYLEARFGHRLGTTAPTEPVWALPCFFVAIRWRGRGVLRALVDAAVDAAAASGAGRPTQSTPACRAPRATAFRACSTCSCRRGSARLNASVATVSW
jgi:GNAT superfamily N-acetyltransferase